MIDAESEGGTDRSTVMRRYVHKSESIKQIEGDLISGRAGHSPPLAEGTKQSIAERQDLCLVSQSLTPFFPPGPATSRCRVDLQTVALPKGFPRVKRDSLAGCSPTYNLATLFGTLRDVSSLDVFLCENPPLGEIPSKTHTFPSPLPQNTRLSSRQALSFTTAPNKRALTVRCIASATGPHRIPCATRSTKHDSTLPEACISRRVGFLSRDMVR
jgi:hypothetical protein